MTARLPFVRRFGAYAASAAFVLGAVGGLSLWSGCHYEPKLSIGWQAGPFFKPTNYTGVRRMPAEVRRVAMLPVSGIQSLTADMASTVEDAARGAVLAEGRFETVVVDPGQLRQLTGQPAVRADELLPPAMFERIAPDAGADAVLMVEVTTFRPYPPMVIGVRAKLAQCDAEHTILWAFDTVYDMREAQVANSARRFASGGGTSIVDTGPAVVQSPSRFVAYVFADMFATLPQRPLLGGPPADDPPKVPRHRAD